MKKTKVSITVYNSIFIVISMILGFLGRLSILPVFPFLKLDFSDIPAFIVTLIFGIPSGFTVLLISSLFRTLMFSSSGWTGFIMRCTSLIMILFLGWCNSKKIKKIYKICGITFGIIFCLILKLCLNYFIWTNFFGMSTNFLNTIMISVIIPYNLLKLIITVTCSLALVNSVKKIIRFSSDV